MTDTLGWRMRMGVVSAAANTVIQPELEAMRPRGVTNQITRVGIPDTPISSDEELAQLMQSMRASIETAIDALMACVPRAVVLGLAAESFWENIYSSDELQAHLQERTGGLGVALGSVACRAAIQKYGGVKRIAIITPYVPTGDAQVRRAFTDLGFEVVNLLGLKCASPLLMGHEPLDRLRRAVREVDDPSVELIIQVGSGLPFAQVAAEAERWLGKPVLAVNTCTYWYALRQAGIEDKVDGFGSLLADY